jgi:hypothetical protein
VNIKQKIKAWLDIRATELEIEHLRAVILAQTSRITSRMQELDKLTREDVDVGVRGACSVVLTGVYRGRGYVRFYEIPAEDFSHFVEMFRSREKQHLLRNIDVPYMMSGAFDLGGGKRK